MRFMLKLRKWLAQYNEIYYLIFVIGMGMLASFGFNSSQTVYKVVFVAGALMWALKMVTTNYKFREVVFIGVIFALLGVTLLRNGERMLLIPAMAVVGAKGVSVRKTFAYGFWSKLAVTVLTMAAAAADIINNVLLSNKKGSVASENFCFGYAHPNHAYLNLFMMAVMAVVLWKNKMRWYIYIIMTGVMFAFYKLLACRTGLLVWILAAVAFIVYEFVQNTKFRKLYLSLFAAIPSVMLMITFVTAFMYQKGNHIAVRINTLLHDRVSAVAKRLPEIGKIGIGSVHSRPFDNGYFYLIYNYGIVMAVILLITVTLAILYLVSKKMDYEAMVLGIVCVYIFMEYAAISSIWNFTVILIAQFVFAGKGEPKPGQ